MRLLVVGLGRSGLGVLRLAARRGQTAVWMDDRPASRDVAEALALGASPLASPDLPPVDLVVAAPGVPLTHPLLRRARQQGLEVIGEIELAYRLTDLPIVAVTGTAGKTTTTTLTAHLLGTAGFSVGLGGNIDPPLVEVIDTPHDVLVVELSSFQSERSPTLRPLVTVLLNLGRDHIDRHGSLAAYHAAKTRVLENLTPESHLVVNADDPAALTASWTCPAGRHTFSVLDSRADARLAAGWLVVLGERVIRRADFPLDGDHHLSNALAACLAAQLAGAPIAALAEGLRTTPRVPGRYQEVARAERDGHLWRYVDDSIATRELAVKAALESTPPPIAWILGGQDKGAEPATLAPAIRNRVTVAIAIGRDGPRLAEAVGAWTHTLVVAEPDGRAAMRAAVGLATSSLPEGGTILLAPLCASFDQFADYRDRSEAFRQAAVSQASELHLRPLSEGA